MYKSCRYRKLQLLIAAVGCAALASIFLIPANLRAAGKSHPVAAAKDQGTGELVIKRSANLGSTIVGLSIDGKQVAKINFNGTYEAPIPSGAHTLSTIPIPNREHAEASQVQINVQPGKTYSLTAYRDDVRIVLKK